MSSCADRWWTLKAPTHNCLLAIANLGTGYRSDEHSGRSSFDVGGVPRAGGIDSGFSRLQGHFSARAFDFLVQSDSAFDAQNQFIAVRVHFPGGPWRVEGVHRDKTPFEAIAALGLSVTHVPVRRIVELGESFDAGTEPQMRGISGQVEHVVAHHNSLAQARPICRSALTTSVRKPRRSAHITTSHRPGVP